MIAELLWDAFLYLEWDAERERSDAEKLQRIQRHLIAIRCRDGQLGEVDEAILGRINRWQSASGREPPKRFRERLEADSPKAMTRLKNALYRDVENERTYKVFGKQMGVSERKRAELRAAAFERELGPTFVTRPDQRARLAREWLRNMVEQDEELAAELRAAGRTPRGKRWKRLPHALN